MPLICDGDMNQRVRRSSGEPVGAKPDWTELKPGGREGGLPGVSVLPAQPRKGKSICQPPPSVLCTALSTPTSVLRTQSGEGGL